MAYDVRRNIKLISVQDRCASGCTTRGNEELVGNDDGRRQENSEYPQYVTGNADEARTRSSMLVIWGIREVVDRHVFGV